MERKKGKNLMISTNGVIYGGATDCSYQIDTETKEIAKTSVKHGTSAGTFKEFETVANSWQGESSHVVAADDADKDAIIALQLAGMPVDVSFDPVELIAELPEGKVAGDTGTLKAKTGGTRYFGKAIITQVKESAPVDGEATWSITYQGTGPLDKAKVTAV